LGPIPSTVPQRCVYVARLVASEEGELEVDDASPVPGIAVLTCLRRLAPSFGEEEGGDSLMAPFTDREIEIVMLPSDRARVEVDGPPAEQPLVEPFPAEQSVQPGQRLQLLRRTHAPSVLRLVAIPPR
jgi:hypothetical protein